jgi:hypothetical protein
MDSHTEHKIRVRQGAGKLLTRCSDSVYPFVSKAAGLSGLPDLILAVLFAVAYGKTRQFR